MAQPLHHEHIVRINDPANITGAWLTREQLWAGLRHTVLAPELLDKSIDSASVRIEEPAPQMLFVRFTYDVCGLEAMRDEQEDSARCSAYQCLDIERIREARLFAAHKDRLA